MSINQRLHYARLLFWRHAGAIAFVFLTAVVIFAFYVSTSDQLARDRNVQIRTCERVQLLRDQSNGTNILIFDTFNRVVKQQQAVIDSGKLKGVALKQAKVSLKRAKDVVATTVVTGPTNCVEASDHPDTYRAPAPEFIVNGGPRVAVARKGAQEIVDKAKTQTPLYGPAPTHSPFPKTK